jgi:hypothetical protein
MSDTIGQQIRLPRLGAGPDASPGNRNALKHGKYTREALARLGLLRSLFGNAASYWER